jgi:hypothetical protein
MSEMSGFCAEKKRSGVVLCGQMILTTSAKSHEGGVLCPECLVSLLICRASFSKAPAENSATGSLSSFSFYTLRGQKLRFSCHSERSEESLPSTSQAKRFFTPLRSVQNDTTCTSGEEKRNSCPWAV